MRPTRAKGGSAARAGWGGLIGAILILVALALQTGPVKVGYGETLAALGHGLTGGWLAGEVETRAFAVIWEIRLPRILVALGVGAALSAAGACLQGLFRNPLADPGLIGVSSGGAIGAILAIGLAGASGWGSAGWFREMQVPLWAIAGALLTTATVYRIARIAGKTHISTLLLAGIAVNALAGAVVGSIIYMSDNEALRRFTFWTLGSLASVTWTTVAWMLPILLAALLLLPTQSRALNAFLLGEAEAYHLGFDTQRTKRLVIALSALMVGLTVAFCGLIGFVGLVVPHIARLLWGPDFRVLLPASACLGAAHLLAADLVARTLNAPAEIPIGIVTSLVGAPFFLYLIARRKRQLSV